MFSRSKTPKLSSTLAQDTLGDALKDYTAFEKHIGASLKSAKMYDSAFEEMVKAREALRDDLDALELFKRDESEHKQEATLSSSSVDAAFSYASEQAKVEELLKLPPMLAHLSHAMQSNLKASVYTPLQKFNKVFKGINDNIKRFDKVAAEFERAKEKAERVRKSSASDINKIAKADKQLQAAEKAFLEESDFIPEELPLFYDMRGSFVEPSLAALAQAQRKYLDGLTSTLNTMFATAHATDDEYQAEIDELFDELKALSITADD